MTSTTKDSASSHEASHNACSLNVQPHSFSARLQFDETFALPYVFAVMNCPVVTLRLFVPLLHSTVSMRSLLFLQLPPALTEH